MQYIPDVFVLILLQIYTIKQHSFDLNVFLQRLHGFGLHFMHLLLMGVAEIAYIYIYSFGRRFYPQWHTTEECFIKSFHPSGTVTLEVWQSKPWLIYVRVASSPSWQHCLLIDSQKRNGMRWKNNNNLLETTRTTDACIEKRLCEGVER